MVVHWIWLATRHGINSRDKRKVLAHFQDPEDVYFAASYAGIAGLSQKAREALEDKDLGPAEAVLTACRRKEIRVLTYQDKEYPARLKNIEDPPLVLYCKGELPDFSERPLIGVVGTRKASVYGLRTAKRLGYQIAKCGGIVVTGMAEGVDGQATQGALTAGKPAIGVLGCGVDQVYPISNRDLFMGMERGGCLLSEYPPGTPPRKWYFPRRNRIISGICNGVLVVEAPEKSGALITAKCACDQGRDLFAVPGNIDVATCAGSNALLRGGAMAVSSGWEVLSEYECLYPGKLRKDYSSLPPEAEEAPPMVAQVSLMPQKMGPARWKTDKKDIDKEEFPPYSDGNIILPALSPEERSVVSLLGRDARLVDEVIAQTNLPMGKALAMLTGLQAKGVVTLLPGRQVILKKQKE